MKSLYHDLKEKQGVEAARTLVRTVLENNNGNVSAAKRVLTCSRYCIRRARDGTLEDGNKTPHHQPKKTKEQLEELVLKVRKKTGYGKIRLRKHLKLEYGLTMSENTIRRILKRGKVKKQVYKRSKRASKPLYDYEALIPFEEGQIDTKYIDDFGALGPMVFNLRRYNLPLYQWTYVCAKTKLRFLAYSYQLTASHGQLFIALILLWLRACGIDTEIHLQGDNGMELCAGSKKKEEKLNELLRPWKAHFRSIPAGKKYLQGIVERSHRTDDEEFYRPHLENIQAKELFLQKAQMWQDTYNMLRPSWGRGMNGKTPLQKLKQSAILIPEKLLHFPVLCLDDILNTPKSGNYLRVHYRYFVAILSKQCMLHRYPLLYYRQASNVPSLSSAA